MGKKLYFGGLSYNTTEETLGSEMANIGNVESVTIIRDKETNRSKGFGFVEMSTDEEAAQVISTWDGKEFEGRKIRVSEARPFEKRPPTRSDRY